MIGTVIAMEPAEFQAWLERRPPDGFAGGRRREAVPEPGRASPATCRAARRGPMLTNMFGKPVELQGGGTVIADEAYLRESIVNPAGEDRRRLPAAHADVPGAGHRRTAAAAHRLHQVAEQPGGAPEAPRRSRQCARGARHEVTDIYGTP